ncbi:MAG: TonB C-terminal domain-containing protein [Desulfobulbaceae bacterium]|nr:TonB C-terminal domain-containing protein [Desulfobulbaceae bacterium]
MVHVITFTLSATLPEILDRKPLLDQVVTVNLVSLPEPAGLPQQKAPPPPAEVTKPEPVVEPEAAVKIPVEPQAVPPPAEPVIPVSLKPIKRKVQKADPKKIAEDEARRKRELERQKALARVRQEEKIARDAAQDARAALAEMLRRQGIQQSAPASGRRSSGDARVNSIVEQNYYAALYDRVQQFWVLPEMRQWNPSLETIVVATIRRDGSIAKTVVEKKSTDPFFDQLAMKTLQKAVPLPGFPKLMTQNSIEIGLRFRPGELLSM